MSRTRVKRSALVSLIFLAPMPAWAECAWVLWGQTPGPMGLIALPMDAFTSRDECQAETARADEKMVAEIKEGRSTVVVIRSCLPDTIDPRGPKGGTR